MAKQKLVLPADALKAKMDEFLVSIPQLAADIKMSPSMIRNFLSGKARISLPIAFKLAKYFGTTFEYWNNIQLLCDLDAVKKDAEVTKQLKAISKAKKPTAKQLAAAESGKEQKAARKSSRGRAAASAKDAAEKPEKPSRRGARAQEAPKGRRAAAVKEKPASRPRRGEKTEAAVKASPRRGRSRSRSKPAAVREQEEEAHALEPKKLEVILIKNNRPVPREEQMPEADPVGDVSFGEDNNARQDWPDSPHEE